MDPDHDDLIRHFGQMSDDELLRQVGSDALTEAARAIALAEVGRRGLAVPVAATPSPPRNTEYAGDFETVARFLNPTDAYVVCSCLEAAGVPAMVADAQLAQTNSLWTIAMGGVRVLVPALHVAEAKEVIAAYERGAFALGDEDEPS
jgi:hypothetical protein